MAYKRPDFEILVGVKGGGQIAGESAQKIRSELNQIFNDINSKSGQSKISAIKPKVDDSFLRSSIQAAIQSCNGVSVGPSVLPDLKVNIDSNYLTSQVQQALEKMPAVKIKVKLDVQRGVGGGGGAGTSRQTTLDQAIQRSAAWKKQVLGYRKELQTTGLPSARQDELRAAIRYAQQQDRKEIQRFIANNNANRQWNAVPANANDKRHVYDDADIQRLFDWHGEYMAMPDVARAKAALDVSRGSSRDMFAARYNKASSANNELTKLAQRLSAFKFASGSDEEQMVQDALAQISGLQNKLTPFLQNALNAQGTKLSDREMQRWLTNFSAYLADIDRITKAANAAESKAKSAEKKNRGDENKARGLAFRSLVDQRKSIIQANKEIEYLNRDPEKNKDAIATWRAIALERRKKFAKDFAAYEPNRTDRMAIFQEIESKKSVIAAKDAKSTSEAAASDKERQAAFEKLVKLKRQELDYEREIAKLSQDSASHADEIAKAKDKRDAVQKEYQDEAEAYRDKYTQSALPKLALWRVNQDVEADPTVKFAQHELDAQNARGTDAQRKEIYDKIVNLRAKELRLNKEIQNLTSDDASKAENALVIDQKRAALLEVVADKNRLIGQLSGTQSKQDADWKAIVAKVNAEDKVIAAQSDVKEAVARKMDAERVTAYEELVDLTKERLEIEKQIATLSHTGDDKVKNHDQIAALEKAKQNNEVAYNAAEAAYSQKYKTTTKGLKDSIEKEDKIVKATASKNAQENKKADAERVAAYEELVRLAKIKKSIEVEGAKFTNRDKPGAIGGPNGTLAYEKWVERQAKADEAYKSAFKDYSDKYAAYHGDLEQEINDRKEIVDLVRRLDTATAAASTTELRRSQNAETAFMKLQQRTAKLFSDNEEALSAHPELYSKLYNLVNQMYDFDAKNESPLAALTKHFDGDIRKALNQLLRLESEIEHVDAKQLTLGQKVAKVFKEKFGYGVMAAAADAARRSISQLYTNVVELEDAMAQMKIVTGASTKALKEYSEGAAEAAKATGRTMTEIMASSTEYARLGYNLEESLKLSETTAKLSNVADIDTAEATSAMTAILKGFRLEARDAEMVGDMMTEVANKYAIDAGELGAALERGGASLAAANNTLAESMALMAAGNAAIQNAETVGKQHCPAA